MALSSPRSADDTIGAQGRNIMRAILLASACAVAQVAAALPAHAQSDQAEDGEIVVTAERRSTFTPV